jgi:hypothetical protein
MSERANPFGDLGDFAPGPAKPKPDRAALDQVAEESGFVSRQPAKATVSEPVLAAPVSPQAQVKTGAREQRRFRTGRDKQVNIKATDETIERMKRMADDRRIPLGHLLELALDALEKAS